MNPGERYTRFIENLTIPKGKHAGKPFRLVDWQRQYIRQLFGTLRDDGKRQYRYGLVFIPKQNGKSLMSSSIAVASLFLNEEHGAQIISAANSRQQACICFDEAAAMIRAEPTLNSLCKIRDSRKTIYLPKTNSTYRAISADAGDKNGLSPSVTIYDEIAEAPDRELWEKLETGTVSRSQPLMLGITTAGDVGSIGHELYLHASAVRDNPGLDAAFLPLIFESKPDEPWDNIETWKRCNPSWGITVEPDYVKAAIEQAKQSPSKLNSLLRYHLNRWVNADSKWIAPEKWSACNETYPLEKLDGRPCWIGCDLAATVDVAALLMLFPLDDGKLVLVPRFYIPKDTAVERERIERVPWLSWEREGFATLTPGNVIDYDYIRQDINEIAKRYNIRRVAMDPWNATQLATQLSGDGLPVVMVRQGFVTLSPPAKEFEKLILSRRIIHNGNPIASWMVSNTVLERDAAGNIKPSKARSADKIDYVVASLMALATYLTATPADRGEANTSLESLLTWL